MDRPNQEQDNSNILALSTIDSMSTVPSYSLYGMSAPDPLPEQVHWESIAERSRLYDWEIKPHRHEHFFQILYIREGSGEALLEDRRLQFPRRSVITIPPRLVHGFVFSRDVDGLVITLNESYLHLLLALAPEANTRLEQPRFCRFTAKQKRASSVEFVLQRFSSEIAEFSPWRGAAIGALLTLLLVGLAREARDEGMQSSPHREGRIARHFEQFQRLLESRYRGNREVSAYAADLGISPTQLNRICRSEAGKSALQMINHRVVVEAKRDLIFSGLDVKQIAMTLGFADPAYFARFFIRHSGITPTDFRRKARDQQGA